MRSSDTPPGEKVGVPRRWVASAALLSAGLLAGGIVAGTQIAGAQDGTTSPPTSTATMGTRVPDAVDHGPGEELLTGATARKVEAAAMDAVPGGSVLRVETDSEGSPYEAHVQQTDGSVVTVKVDEAFNVTETVDGFGAGPHPAASTNPDA